MYDERFWQEGIDGKRFALCLFRKIWILPAAGALCAAAFVLVYLFVTLVLSGGQQYQVFSQYRIYFDSEKYGLIEDYYNAYTWGEIMKTDQVLDFVMEHLPEEITKDQVKASVSVGQMNDVKVMPLTVVSEDPQIAAQIAAAYVPGLEAFAQSIEGLSGMECWLVEEPEAIPRATRTVYAGGFGFVLGMIAALVGMLLFYVLDDAIYLEEDLDGQYDWPVIGVRTKRGGTPFDVEFVANWNQMRARAENVCIYEGGSEQRSEDVCGRRKPVFLYCCDDAEKLADIWVEGAEKKQKMGNALGNPEDSVISEVDKSAKRYTWPLNQDDLEELQQCSGAVLVIPWGMRGGRLLRHIDMQLKKWDVPVAGAVICQADERYLWAYYGVKQK